MPKIRRTPPKQSVFSVNPSTGRPYIDIERATSLINKNINLKHSGMLKKFDIEDLRQDVFVRLSLCNFDLTKSSPTTWIINLSDQVMWNKWRHSKNRGRDLIVPEFDIIGQDGEEMISVIDTLEEDVTPEEVLKAKQLLEDFEDNPTKTANGATKICPYGWRGLRKTRKV